MAGGIVKSEFPGAPPVSAAGVFTYGQYYGYRFQAPLYLFRTLRTPLYSTWHYDVAWCNRPWRKSV